MRLAWKSCVLLLSLIFSGCAIKHDYVWVEYPIEPSRISTQGASRENAEANIIRGASSGEKAFLGSVGAHQYYGSNESLADGIVEQLIKEMRKKQVAIKDASAKSLEIAVTSARFERGMWKIAAALDFTVKFGNGKVKSYAVRNSSPATVDRAYNGAVALAVMEIINDPEVFVYINE